MSGYGGGHMFDPAAGQGYVGDDWQKYDWDKLAQSDTSKGQQQNQMAQMAGMTGMPGMEGMTQKQINKSVTKVFGVHCTFLLLKNSPEIIGQLSTHVWGNFESFLGQKYQC